MNTSFEDANAAADRVAINVIVVEAADATADRVAVNATIVNEGAHAVAGRVSAISVWQVVLLGSMSRSASQQAQIKILKSHTARKNH